jgi:hypothetical protein
MTHDHDRIARMDHTPNGNTRTAAPQWVRLAVRPSKELRLHARYLESA